MALQKCKECGNEVSSKAKACPQCGAAQPKKTSVFTWIIGGFFAVAVVAAVVGGTSSSTMTPEQHAASKQKSESMKKTMLALQAIKKSMRDPDSLKWEDITANDDASVICISYRAKNGFGGMNRDIATVVNDKFHTDKKTWNKHCTKPMNDMQGAGLVI